MKIKNQPYLLLTMAMLFWAGNFILGRAFHKDIPPISLAFWRWLGAAFIVTWPALPHMRRDYTKLLRSWPVVLLLSVLGIACFNTLAYSGLQHTEAINAFLIQSLMPVMIVLLSFFIFREKITLIQLIGVLISLSGAVVIIIRGDADNFLKLTINQGDFLIMTAILCYAGYSVVLRKRPFVHPLAFLCSIFWIGTAVIFPFYLWEMMNVSVIELRVSNFLVIGYVIIFPSIVSYLCYNRGVELVGANRAGLFIHLMPVFGSLMAVLFLNESFRWYHGTGILLIGLGIFMATRMGVASAE